MRKTLAIVLMLAMLFSLNAGVHVHAEDGWACPVCGEWARGDGCWNCGYTLGQINYTGDDGDAGYMPVEEPYIDAWVCWACGEGNQNNEYCWACGAYRYGGLNEIIDGGDAGYTPVEDYNDFNDYGYDNDYLYGYNYDDYGYDDDYLYGYGYDDYGSGYNDYDFLFDEFGYSYDWLL